MPEITHTHIYTHAYSTYISCPKVILFFLLRVISNTNIMEKDKFVAREKIYKIIERTFTLTYEGKTGGNIFSKSCPHPSSNFFFPFFLLKLKSVCLTKKFDQSSPHHKADLILILRASTNIGFKNHVKFQEKSCVCYHVTNSFPTHSITSSSPAAAVVHLPTLGLALLLHFITPW